MKKIIYILILISGVHYSCDKEDEPLQIINKELTLSGYRGDTISLKTNKINHANLVVLLISSTGSYYQTSLLKSTNENLKFVIPENLYNIKSSFLLKGEEKIRIKIYDGDYMVCETSLKVFFEPVVFNVDMPNKISYGDTLIALGRDLDINTLRIYFNTLEPKIINQSSRMVSMIVPDSCGSGILEMYCSSTEWSGYSRILLEQEYQLNLISNFKLPKKVTSIWDEDYIKEYSLKFNFDNQLVEFDIFNAVGSNYNRWKRYYTYNNSNHLFYAKTTFDGKLTRIDSFEHSDNKIIELRYLYPSLEIERKIEYQKDENDRIISSINMRPEDGTTNWEECEIRNFEFLDNNKCFLTITEPIHNNRTAKYLLKYDNKNFKVPLQLNTYMRGLELNTFNDLDYMFFPGSIIYREFIGYSNRKRKKLYFDAGGNLVKEENYLINYKVYHGDELELQRTILWEY
jgi:hypothetical protein